jgi:hypothetical protein
MKRLVLALSILLVLFSCKKENIEPEVIPNRYQIVVDSGKYDISNKTYVLTDGKVYLENMENGSKTYYSLFDSNQTVSGMRLGSYKYPIEKLELGVTTWGFFLKGEMVDFRLNGDSLDPYEFNVSNSSYSIIEHRQSTQDGPITLKMGGSSKPVDFYVVDEVSGIIRCYVHEAYTTINNMQYTYFNELEFQEVK